MKYIYWISHKKFDGDIFFNNATVLRKGGYSTSILHYEIWIVCLSAYLEFTLEVRPTNPYILRISTTRGTFYARLYSHTPVLKKPQNGTIARKKKCSTGLKLWHADTTWLQITCGGSHLATPLPLCVQG